MVFFNQTSAADGSVRLSTGAGTASFEIELDRLPAEIAKIVFCVTTDKAHNLSGVSARG